MKNKVSVRGLQKTPAQYLRDVHDNNHRYIVERDGWPVAALVPMSDLERLENNMSEDRPPYGDTIIIERLGAGNAIDRETIDPKGLLGITIQLPDGAITISITDDEVAIRTTDRSLLSIRPRAANLVHVKPTK